MGDDNQRSWSWARMGQDNITSGEVTQFAMCCYCGYIIYISSAVYRCNLEDLQDLLGTQQDFR